MNKIRLLLPVLVWIFACQSNKTESDHDTNSDASSADTIVYEYSSFEDGHQIFENLNYTPEAWESGIREIPNLLLMKIPRRWRQSTTQQIEVKMKKAIFFRVLAPLALVVNREIMKDRKELEAISEYGLKNATEEQKASMNQLGLKYKVIKAQEDLTSDHLKELLSRADEIPLSLVMAQSAEESGWGTSRFAAEGNALFGQWAWGTDAIKPKEQRSGMGNYGIARFDTPLESMRAYMHNLNTHNAYSELRKVRADMRSTGKKPDGPSLAHTLIKYSERGQEYVETLLSLMRVNNLVQADSAYLKENPVILMVPLE